MVVLLEIWEAIDKLVGTKVFYGANTVSVHAGRSKDDKVPFQIKPVLKTFLNKDIEIVFIRDSDGISEDWRKKLYNYSERKEVKLHLLERYEIENYILNANLIKRALEKKYPRKDIPTEEEIKNKIFEFLKNTIVMSKFKYDDNLEDSIFKIGLLLNLQEYRNTSNVKREAEKIRSDYEDNNEYELYLKIGMGKETLKQLFKWLNSDIKLNLNKEDILDVIQLEDVSEELIQILKMLKSNIRDQDEVIGLEEFVVETGAEEDIEEDVEASVQQIVQLSLPIESVKKSKD